MQQNNLKREALEYHAGNGGEGGGDPDQTVQHAAGPQLGLQPWGGRAVQGDCENPQDVYTYTAKGNLVAVISNGTAVLGLGDIGPAASKPVMEGKGVLFKVFADIDVFDIEVDATDVDQFVRSRRSHPRLAASTWKTSRLRGV